MGNRISHSFDKNKQVLGIDDGYDFSSTMKEGMSVAGAGSFRSKNVLKFFEFHESQLEVINQA